MAPQSGALLRAGHWANWPAVKIILPVWFVFIGKVFLIKKFSTNHFVRL